MKILISGKTIQNSIKRRILDGYGPSIKEIVQIGTGD
jgi:hypothetical protein